MQNPHKLLQIAYNNKDEIVSVFDVPTGIKCDCHCPECGEPLEAKNRGKFIDSVLLPNQKVAHFAHSSGKNCLYATETAIHKLAKFVLQLDKKLMLPRYYSHDIGMVLFKGGLFEFDEAFVENVFVKDGKKIVPDVTLLKNKKQLFIEFFKTHQIDFEKYEKIEEFGISTIEIDLNSVEPLHNGQINIAGIREFLQSDVINAHWIYNANVKSLLKNKIKNDEDLIFQQEQELQRELAHDYEVNFGKKDYEMKDIEWVKQWKDKTIKMGYSLIKIYNGWWDSHTRYPYKAQTVYCPKEPKESNKTQYYTCQNCQYFYSLYYHNEDTFLFCGFKSGIVRQNKK